MILKHRAPGGGFRFIDGINTVRHDEDHYLLDENRPVPQKVGLFENNTLYVNPRTDGAVPVASGDSNEMEEVRSGVQVIMDSDKGQSGLRPMDLVELTFVTDESEDATEPALTRTERRTRLAIDMEAFLMTDEGQTIERLR